MTSLDRITQQPDVMGGKPCIRDTRATVSMIVGQIGGGHGIDDILADYPYLEREDVLQALRYAAMRAEMKDKKSAIGWTIAILGAILGSYNIFLSYYLIETGPKYPNLRAGQEILLNVHGSEVFINKNENFELNLLSFLAPTACIIGGFLLSRTNRNK